uniref:phenylalanine--tRNA ligase alpha subunit n=1 Tax=Myxine glutinosa TaxID=7769 RepID=UPI00358E09F3
MAEATLSELVLQRLAEAPTGLDSCDLANTLGHDHQAVVGAIKSLQSLGEVISAQQRSTKRWELTSEGQEVVREGSHEARVFDAIPPSGILQKELMKLPSGKVGFSKAMSNKWIVMDKTGENGPRIFRIVDEIADNVKEKLQIVAEGKGDGLEEKEKTDLKKRKLLNELIVKSYWITKGPSFSTTVMKQETDLTSEMIISGSWRGKQFKPYNFDALGIMPDSGHLHPLMKVRSQFRQIFLEMGFTEMPTNNYIESSFWNFDALFQPQQHPARDAHDTFFISDPALASRFPMDYLERVKRVHSEGGYGSLGYRYDWKFEEAQKNLLRTHTTGVSARMLYQLAQQEKFTPAKYFSIDRVFRNETLDATHLAEFHQIEGLVVDFGLTLGNLMGVLHQFFTKLGITKLRFKPAYNPYTEPSMEVFSYHEGLKKWVEVGNSGVFRPEMLLPMGLPEGVSVIAWGLSLERPTMIKYGINNIRELVGHKVNLQMVYNNPICRLDEDKGSNHQRNPIPL